MTIRETLARWLCPELGRKADKHHYLWHRIDESMWWLSAYPEISAAMQRLIELDRDHWRGLDEPATGVMPHQIHDFRSMLEQRMAKNELPFSFKDIERGLILFRTSNNSQGYTNFVSLTAKVDALPSPAKIELANMMTNIAAELREKAK